MFFQEAVATAKTDHGSYRGICLALLARLALRCHATTVSFRFGYAVLFAIRKHKVLIFFILIYEREAI